MFGAYAFSGSEWLPDSSFDLGTVFQLCQGRKIPMSKCAVTLMRRFRIEYNPHPAARQGCIALLHCTNLSPHPRRHIIATTTPLLWRNNADPSPQTRHRRRNPHRRIPPPARPRPRHPGRRHGRPRKHARELCRDRRTVTAPTALILARVFGNNPDFWLNTNAAPTSGKRSTPPKNAPASTVPAPSPPTRSPPSLFGDAGSDAARIVLPTEALTTGPGIQGATPCVQCASRYINP